MMGQADAGQSKAAGNNPDLDTGTSLGGAAAPDIKLTNQFGQPMSMSQFRGKVVILAFVDSQCTTVCPLTTVSMVAAKQLLGAAGSRVQLLGVDANPDATSVPDVMAYSRAHAVQNQQGMIDHTPALFVIDAHGRERTVYLTQMNYASITQAAQILAQRASSLLPGHPPLTGSRSLAYISGQPPTAKATLPGVPSGSV